MSEQLKKGGNPVGSNAYFFSLAGENQMLKHMQGAEAHRYYDILGRFASRAEQTLEVIYRDMQRYADTLRYFPERDRQHTAELVRGLGKLAEYGGRSASRVSSVNSLLQLSSYDTRAHSSASVSEIERWSEPVIRGVFFHEQRQLELLKKACESNDVSVSDDREFAFLDAVCLGKSRDQLKDMFSYAKYRIEHTRYRGEGGDELCTKQYIAWAEYRVFERTMSGLWGYEYKDYLQKQFETIAQTIREDLKNGQWHNDFLKDEEAERLRVAVRHLEKCGVSCYDLSDLIEKLDWYIKADENHVLKLQRALNALRITPSLVEDGILGEKTIAELKNVYDMLNRDDHPKLQCGKIPKPTEKIDFERHLEQIEPAQSFFEGTTHILNSVGKSAGEVLDTNKAAVRYANRALQKAASSKLMRIENNLYITKDAAMFMEKFGSKLGVIKIAGIALAVSGIILDVIQAAIEVYYDIKDDGLIGRRSMYAVFELFAVIVVSQLFEKVGSLVGTLAGPLGASIGAYTDNIIMFFIEDAVRSSSSAIVDLTGFDRGYYGTTLETVWNR